MLQLELRNAFQDVAKILVPSEAGLTILKGLTMFCFSNLQSTYMYVPFSPTSMIFNMKLSYREEHSASVVLSWCTLGYFSGENLLMANQPRLRNWPRKLPNSAK